MLNNREAGREEEMWIVIKEQSLLAQKRNDVFQNFRYWFKPDTGQGVDLVCSVDSLRSLWLGLEIPVPSLSHLDGSFLRQSCVSLLRPPSPQPPAPQADTEVLTRQQEPAPCKLLSPSLHFSRCLESILFCSHSAPKPNPFQYWLWATVYNEIQMSMTYGKSDSH